MINIYSVVDNDDFALYDTPLNSCIYTVFPCIYMGKFSFDQGWQCVYQCCHVVIDQIWSYSACEVLDNSTLLSYLRICSASSIINWLSFGKTSSCRNI